MVAEFREAFERCLLAQVKVLQTGLRVPLSIFVNESSHVEQVLLFCASRFEAAFVRIAEFASVTIEMLPGALDSGQTPGARGLSGFLRATVSAQPGVISAVNRTVQVSGASLWENAGRPRLARLFGSAGPRFAAPGRAPDQGFFIATAKPSAPRTEAPQLSVSAHFLRQASESPEAPPGECLFRVKGRSRLEPVDPAEEPRIWSVDESSQRGLDLEVSVLSTAPAAAFEALFRGCAEGLRETAWAKPVLLRLGEFVFHERLDCELKAVASFRRSALDLKNPFLSRERAAAEFLFFADAAAFKAVLRRTRFRFLGPATRASPRALRLYRPFLRECVTEGLSAARALFAGARGKCFGLEVTGVAGTGKSFLARRVAAELATPVFEVDLRRLLFARRPVKFSEFLQKVRSPAAKGPFGGGLARPLPGLRKPRQPRSARAPRRPRKGRPRSGSARALQTPALAAALLPPAPDVRVRAAAPLGTARLRGRLA